MLVALDFESEAIDTRPNYPPTPVGLAIYLNGAKPFYLAWGHPTNNNSRYEDAKVALELLLVTDSYELVFHNAAFDCAIIEEKMGLKVPWSRVHDTMLQAFLIDPFGQLSLKPLAELHLGELPTERDAVREWLVVNGVCRANDKNWGAHICKAPGDLVGTYAIGDVRKTLDLYKKFKETIDRKSNVRYTYTPGEAMTPEEAARTPR